MSSNETRKKILEVKNLDVVFGSGKKTFKAIDGVSFDIYEGETFGLVGESGSGKTTIGRAIIRINEAAGGEILYKGERISGKISPEMDRKVIENIQMIFQDPMASLNERAKVDYIISEGLYNHHKFKNEEERKQIVSQALLDVGLLPEFASRFPHEFSGGQRQRIGIARALVMEPQLVIADEPISALDVSIRAQVLNLLSELQKKKASPTCLLPMTYPLSGLFLTGWQLSIKGILWSWRRRRSFTAIRSTPTPAHYCRRSLSRIP